MDTCLNCLTEAVLTSIHDLCFRAKIRKNVYPCKYTLYYMSRDVRKPVFGVSDQVPHKPGWTITEDS